MTLEELASSIETIVGKVEKSTETSLAINGEPFVTLTSGGIKAEGELVPVWCSTEKHAIDLFAEELRRYYIHQAMNTDHDLCLYWRNKPEVVTWEWQDPVTLMRFTLYFVRARLLISDKA